MEKIAKQLLSLMDLTSLNEDDTENTIRKLCDQAVSSFGAVAAVCVYRQFVALAADCLKSHPEVKLATVVNFPAGNDDLATVCSETEQALADGANEIDLVLPYPDLLAGNAETCAEMVKEIADLSHSRNAKLKVILETGAFSDSPLLTEACDIAINNGADFLKTSTGKIAVGATPAAAREICARIKANQVSDRVGIKISGGVRSVADGVQYLDIIREAFGEQWITAEHVRIGASSLLADIQRHLGNH